MPDTSVVIALAGGSGAAIGAGVGQLVQWWRERSHAKLEDRRRVEDRQVELDREGRSARRDTYLDIIGRCIDFRLYLSEVLEQIHTIKVGDTRGLTGLWSTFSDAATDTSREIFRLATTHGSDQIHAAAEKIHYEHYELWRYAASVSFFEPSDPEFFDIQRSRYASRVRSISIDVNRIIISVRSEMHL